MSVRVGTIIWNVLESITWYNGLRVSNTSKYFPPVTSQLIRKKYYWQLVMRRMRLKYCSEKVISFVWLVERSISWWRIFLYHACQVKNRHFNTSFRRYWSMVYLIVFVFFHDRSKVSSLDRLRFYLRSMGLKEKYLKNRWRERGW